MTFVETPSAEKPTGANVSHMFARIAPRYDRANHILSFGRDFAWRKELIRRVRMRNPRSVADLATGSGDVAIALSRSLPGNVEITGYDFCEPMLEEARRKAARLGLGKQIAFKSGDCLDLPMRDASIDVATIAFGVRNFENRAKGLREIHRVLRPGGAFLCLEFTQPARWFRPFYLAYLKFLLPVVAEIITHDRAAYRYLAGSIESFPTKESLSEELTAAGFQRIQSSGMSASIVAIHEAER